MCWVKKPVVAVLRAMLTLRSNGCKIKASGLAAERYVLSCNGRRVLQATGRSGEFVAGYGIVHGNPLRYTRSFQYTRPWCLICMTPGINAQSVAAPIMLLTPPGAISKASR